MQNSSATAQTETPQREHGLPLISARAGVRGDARAPGSRSIEISGGLIKTARLADEWFEDVEDPNALIEDLRRSGTRADLFTFWQRVPDLAPRYDYTMEWDTIAVLPVSTYDHWWKSQINNKTRNLVVKAGKKGVVVRETAFDDQFVEGITAIFNETPVRQERPFLHYGKSVEIVRSEFSRYLFRETLLGAYLDDELIGFVMLADGGSFGALTQIISLLRHRDKSPTNALVAKAVEVCAARQLPRLIYALWPNGPLREFKRHNGFAPVNLPRYYVPLTATGYLAVRLKLYRNPVEYLPENTARYLRGLRSKFYARRFGGVGGAKPPSVASSDNNQ
jgi:hypothetical protein